MSFTIPGSSNKHRILVQWKDATKGFPQNQTLMQFKGLLDVARHMGLAESGEIVTREPWSASAKGFAMRSGINLVAYQEKLSQVFGSRPELRGVVEEANSNVHTYISSGSKQTASSQVDQIGPTDQRSPRYF